MARSIGSVLAAILLSLLASAAGAQTAGNSGGETQKITKEQGEPVARKICSAGLQKKYGVDQELSASFVKVGWHAVDQGRSLDALYYFLTALDTGPERFDAYWGIAVASHAANLEKDITDACLERASVHFSNVSPFHVDRAVVLAAREERALAQQALEKAIELDPENAKAHGMLVRFYVASGDRDGAARHNALMQKLIMKKVDDQQLDVKPEAKKLTDAAKKAVGEQKLDYAVEALYQAIDLEPNYAGAHLMLKLILRKQGEAKRAKQHEDVQNLLIQRMLNQR